MNNDLHQTLLENLFDGVYYVDKNRIITFWNKAAERLTGYSQSEVLGSSCSDNILKHIDANGREMCKNGCPLHATISDGQMRESLLFLHHKQGHRVPVHIRISPIIDKHGDIIGGIEIFSDNSQPLLMLKELEQLKKEAHLDPLLQIGNRRYAEMIFQARLYELDAFDVPFGAILLDIDYFKKVNDSHGHAFGDEVLLMVCRSIGGVLRQLDSLIRWGGDEFLIFLPNVTKEGLQTIAERIQVFIESSFIMVENQKVAVTVSIGASFAQKEETLESIIKRVDLLLYESKQNGRNKLTFG
jgi:diguanylate cyclase (GGDEF)-like protein/PAS domain S-box-containing protein